MGNCISTGHDDRDRKLEKLASQGILALTPAWHLPTLRAMETIHQRIRRLREAKELTQEELAALVGVSRQAVQKWESEGEDRTAPTRKREPALAAALGVTVTELIYGTRARDEVLLLSANDSAQSAYLNGNVIEGPDMARRTFPLISWVQAGMWTEICDNFEPGDADAWLPCHKDLGPHGFVLRVQGESMTTSNGAYSFPDGMLLYVHPEIEALPGRFVIVRRNGNAATFKRLTNIDGALYLEALNPAWPNRYTAVTADDHICGVVVHAGFELP